MFIRNTFSITIATLLALFVLVPQPALAFSCSSSGAVPPSTFSDVVCFVDNIVNTILPIVVGASVLTFFVGLIGVIRKSGDPKNNATARAMILWSIIVLFVMFSFVGILNLFLGDAFGTSVGVPQFPES